MNRMYQRTLEIAKKKLEQGESTEKIHRPRLGTGGGFGDVFLWDTAFTCMWAKYHTDELPVEVSLDNLYRLQDEDGHINRQYLPSGEPKWSKVHPISSAPPVLAWAELELYKVIENKERLVRVYPYLKKHHFYLLETYQMDDGLFFCDPLGCGMDNLPRWPVGWNGDDYGIVLEAEHIHSSMSEAYVAKRVDEMIFRWNRQGRWIDFSAQMAFNALCLEEIANLVQENKDKETYKEHHTLIKNAINQNCWDSDTGFYFDLGFGQQIKRFHIGAFWTLIADVVPPEYQERFVGYLTDEKYFGRPVPVPTLAYCEPEYHPEGNYWLGGVWAPTNYMVFCGLQRIGADKCAKALAKRYYTAVEKEFEKSDTIWENYAPEKPAKGNRAQPDFCGWSGLASVAIFREFIA